MKFANLRLLTGLALVLLVIAACRQQQPAAPADIQLELKASDTRAGETTLMLMVTDADGKPLSNPGTLSVRGDMNHAGMVPVFAEAEGATDGVFSLPFEWTMAGSWLVEASLTLPSGTVASETFTFEILTEANGNDMAPMDHSSMDDAPSEASAVYMRIKNRGESDRVIISAQSAAADQVDFHNTVVDDDIARMEALEALIVPAGETLELRPGGAHIMLSGLREDLRTEAKITLRLKCSTGEVYDLDISIADMPMGDLDDAIELGDLVFSNRWARPARAATMSHDDRPMNSDGNDASS
ncbi:MAG: copper chaperone PCu(A)C [Chloroflexota bacterium]|nr:copper chaperone PCu(A)C [Chloroflexota bacterium]